MTWKEVFIKINKTGTLWGWGSIYDDRSTKPNPIPEFENHRITKICCSSYTSMKLTGIYYSKKFYYFFIIFFCNIFIKEDNKLFIIQENCEVSEHKFESRVIKIACYDGVFYVVCEEKKSKHILSCLFSKAFKEINLPKGVLIKKIKCGEKYIVILGKFTY